MTDKQDCIHYPACARHKARADVQGMDFPPLGCAACDFFRSGRELLRVMAEFEAIEYGYRVNKFLNDSQRQRHPEPEYLHLFEVFDPNLSWDYGD